MLNFEDAKRVAWERWLWAFDKDPGGPHVVLDSECVEYEWGWQIEWGPSRADQVPPEAHRYHFPVLVDRVTGYLEAVGTSGPRMAIMKLLERRPAKSQSSDVSTEQAGVLTRVNVSMRAFTPLSELQAGRTEAGSLEIFRLTDRRGS